MADLPLVFLAFANVENDHLPMLNEEADAIFEALETLHEGRCLEIRPRTAASLEKIQAVFSKGWQRLAVFHYAGHAGKAEIHLTDGSKKAEGIAHMMRSFQSLRLVFLNGCATREQVKALWENGVKVVIATAVPISDQRAKVFASKFYENLGHGQNIKMAFEGAVGFLKADPAYAMDEFPAVRAFDKLEENQQAEEIPWGLYCNPNEPEALDYVLPQEAPKREDMNIPEDPEQKRLLKHLEKLNFYQQSKLMRRYLNRHDLGVFIIHGPEEYGQTWLCNNRFTKMHETHSRQIPPTIKMGRRISNVLNLVKEINNGMLFESWEYETLESGMEALCQRFFKILKTQSVVLRISHFADYLSNGFLQNYIRQFWQPFCQRLLSLQAQNEAEDYHKVIVLFIEEQELRQEEYPDLFAQHIVGKVPEQLDTTKILLLPPIPPVTLEEFENWVESDLADLTQSVFHNTEIEQKANSEELSNYIKSDEGESPEDLMIEVSGKIGFYLDPNDKGKWELIRKN
jgi:hypothetical protein